MNEREETVSDYRDVVVGFSTYIMDQADAIRMVHAIEETFGWCGTFFTRDDVAETINYRRSADDKDELVGDALAEAVDAVWQSHGVRKYLRDAMSDGGWEVINEAIWDEVESKEDD